MHPFVSALASFVLSPFNWIVVLLAGAYFIRRKPWKRLLAGLAVFIFLVFSNRSLLNSFARAWQPAPVDALSLPVYSAGIVAGGFASPGYEKGGYFNLSADRFIQAVRLYKLGKVSHLIISGGNGRRDVATFREAAWVKTQMLQMGIPDSVIAIEDHSRNTQENALYTRRLLDSLQLSPPFLLITSAFHVPRAALVFHKAGVPVDPFPCNYTDGMDRFSWDDLLPRPSLLFEWGRYLKEAVGYFYYRG